MQSITEASLRVATCSGALSLGKIKASRVDVDTAGESRLASVISKRLAPPLFLMHSKLECVACMHNWVNSRLILCILAASAPPASPPPPLPLGGLPSGTAMTSCGHQIVTVLNVECSSGVGDCCHC